LGFSFENIPTDVKITAFLIKTPSVDPTMVSVSFPMNSKLIDAPTAIKNKPKRSPLNGSISLSN